MKIAVILKFSNITVEVLGRLEIDLELVKEIFFLNILNIICSVEKIL